ncbi:MAG: alanine racemase [Armatimonadetes bacterium]|nr:alanine racemase [Armatimonadota bacterium]
MADLLVDLGQIAHNVRQIRHSLAVLTHLCAVVKSNAYGHGLIPVAQTALRAGADSLAVKTYGEGVALRDSGIRAPILVFNPCTRECAEIVTKYRLTPTVGSRSELEHLFRASRRANDPISVHINVETGLNRLGISLDEAVPLCKYVKRNTHLRLGGIYTQMKSVDRAKEQWIRFRKLYRAIGNECSDTPSLHVADSATLLAHPGLALDMVRIGLLAYGIYPAGPLPHSLDIRPALTLRARILRVFVVKRGESVGYGDGAAVRRGTLAATVNAGYFNGVPRRLAGKSAVLVKGRRAPVLFVAMNDTVIDVSEVKGLKEGGEVVLIGRQEREEIALSNWAHACDTIEAEVLCRIRAAPVTFFRGDDIQTRTAV